MKKIVVIGAGGLAETAFDHFKRSRAYDVAAFAVDAGYEAGLKTLCGKPVVGTKDLAKKFPPSRYGAFVAIGYSGMNRWRAERCAALRKSGYALVSLVGPKAVSNAKKIGGNCLVMDGAVVETSSTLADGVIVWGGAIVGHHSTMGAFSFAAIHATVSGRVEVGERCFIGAGAVVTDNLTLGARTFVGAGALVTRGTKPDQVYKAAASEPKPYKSSELKRI